MCRPLQAQSAVAEALAAGRFAEALRSLDAILATNPRNPKVWTARGLALKGLNRSAEGLASFEKAMSIDPNFAPALMGAAELAYSARDRRSGVYLSRLLKLQPESETANAMAGVLAFESKDCASAIGHFRKARGELSRNEIASAQLAQCLLAKGEATEAAAALERTLQSFPESRTARYNAAIAYVQSRRPKEAIRILRPLVDNSPDAGVLNLLASAQAADGQDQAAADSLKRAAELSPGDERNYVDLATLCFQRDAFSMAIDVLNTGLKSLPKSTRLYAMRGIMYAQLSQLDKAASDFEEAGRLEPDQMYGSAGLSVLLTENRQVDEAIALLRGKLARTPNDPALNYLLADAILRKGVEPGSPQWREALSRLETAIRMKPAFGQAWAVLGKMRLKAGDSHGAVEALRKALDYDPANRAALNQLLLALRVAGRKDEAAEVARRLREQLSSPAARVNIQP